MTREDWIERAARRYHEQGGLGITESEVAAKTTYEAFNDRDRPEDPEEAADDEMTYWTDDEGGIE